MPTILELFRDPWYILAFVMILVGYFVTNFALVWSFGRIAGFKPTYWSAYLAQVLGFTFFVVFYGMVEAGGLVNKDLRDRPWLAPLLLAVPFVVQVLLFSRLAGSSDGERAGFIAGVQITIISMLLLFVAAMVAPFVLGLVEALIASFV